MPNYILVKSLLPKADALTKLLVHVMFAYGCNIKDSWDSFILF